jgi:RNA polymerase sigma factor (TIGR02999 family)
MRQPDEPDGTRCDSLDYSPKMREAGAQCSGRHHGARRPMTDDSSIASLADATERGDRAAADALFAALYSELHRLARRELARQGVPLGLSTTTLLHQAYLDMAEREGPAFPDRARFMGYAARVMRGLIIDHARNRQAQKRGGLFEITSLTTDVLENTVDYLELERIGEALDQLVRRSLLSPRSWT